MNYQLMTDRIIEDIQKEKRIPRLLLHSCCAPCSSYVLEYLSQYFEITVFYYNPNIYPDEEYHHRAKEQERFISGFHTKYPVSFVEGPFEKEKFYDMAKGKEDVPEGGERCFSCYEMRLRKCAEYARDNGFDFFTTTLSISPMKNSQKLNEIGGRIATEYGVDYLFSDFKKREGFKRSCEISKEYGMYRQDYCGCEFSKRNRIAE